MLFALDTNGVPSVSKTIKIGAAIPLTENPNLVLHLEFEETIRKLLLLIVLLMEMTLLFLM